MCQESGSESLNYSSNSSNLHFSLQIGKLHEVQTNWCFAMPQEIYLKTTVETTTLLHLEGFVMELL